MKHTEGTLGTLNSRDGFELYTQSWLPDAEARAAIVLIHGQSDHSGRYRHPLNALVPQGYAVYAFDQRGHGKTGGPRGHVPNYQLLLDDVEAVVRQARQAQPGKQIFLYGHSVGGQITLNYALRRGDGLAGVMVTGPWLRLAFEPPGWKVSLSRTLAGLWPGLTLGNEVDPASISHDAAEVAIYRNDPLNHGRISVQAYNEYTTAAEWALQHATELKLPALLMHGGADPLTSPAGTQTFYERASATDRTLRIYEGMYHEVHNELGRDRVFKDMSEWLGDR
ncbi:MAG: lysophospholipase [Chloroflexi bacterium]|nr:lysophospholipase [Chloroflexota bacterium]